MGDLPSRDHGLDPRLAPHQVAFVHQALEAGHGARVLLADDVGTGKTMAVVSFLSEYAKRRENPRIVVITPPVLAAMWRDVMADVGRIPANLVDLPFYRHLQANTPADQNPWTTVRAAVTSLDWVKKEEFTDEIIDAGWDVVVVDEAHHCTRQSQRGRLFERLWNSKDVNVVIAVTATPHTGRADDFLPFIDKRTILIRRRIPDLVDWAGKPLARKLPPTEFVLHPVLSSVAETEFYAEFRDALRTSTTTDLMSTVLLRRAVSSLFAIDQSLRRIPARWHDAEEHSGHESGAEQSSSEAIDVELPIEPILPKERVERLLALLENIEEDSKWERTSRLIDATARDTEHVVVFCEYRDTASYLADLMAGLGISNESITGSDSPDERRDALDRFRENAGVCVITTAMTLGMDLGFATTCIHYDMPWDPRTLFVRLSRFRGSGAGSTGTVHHFLLNEFFGEDRIVQKLLSMEAVDDVSGVVDEFRQFVIETPDGPETDNR